MNDLDYRGSTWGIDLILATIFLGPTLVLGLAWVINRVFA
jgi:hypothetical protein